jgi:hypothetical protein
MFANLVEEAGKMGGYVLECFVVLKRPHDDVARAAERVHSTKGICCYARGPVSKHCNLKGHTVDG